MNDLSLEVPRGSVFGLLGPNGAGKTTTLRMVMNIFAPDAGTIEILGRPADHAARDRIGYMPEERGLYPRMVLEEQLVFMAAIKGIGREGGRSSGSARGSSGWASPTGGRRRRTSSRRACSRRRSSSPPCCTSPRC